MSYDYFLWKTVRHVSPAEIDETTVETWKNVAALREQLSALCPGLIWRDDGQTADDCSASSSIRAMRLPSASKENDPLVVRASHHDSSDGDLLAIGKALRCLVYDAQTGKIVYQLDGDSD